MTTPAASPMMAQYHQIKTDHPDSLLFFRMGDFYELFFDDALKAAPALGIALTKRGRHNDQDVPMCGVPVHSSDTYLHKLIAKGFRVAICEQLEDPAMAKQRGGKPLVRRDVVRIVTPATLTEESLLDARRSNHLAALAMVSNSLGLAWSDVSTGSFVCQALAADRLLGELERLQPGEILIDPKAAACLDARGDLLAEWRMRAAPLTAIMFDAGRAERRLCGFFEIAALESQGDFSKAEIAAAGALLDYLELTQKGNLPRLERLAAFDSSKILHIDAATRRNLELTSSQSGGRAGSLLMAIDRTITSFGARCLAERLSAPLTDIEAIRARHNQVAAFLDDDDRLEALRTKLKSCPDAERALSRVSVGRAGPRDLVSIARAMRIAVELKCDLAAAARPLADLANRLTPPEQLVRELVGMIVDEPPLSKRDGGFIAGGVDKELDDQRRLRDHSRTLIVGLESSYRQSTGINNLKIKHNNLLGYFIEVASQHAGKVPIGFVQRQGMANATRYMSEQLQELGEAIGLAAERARGREIVLFEELIERTRAQSGAIAAVARLLAELDVAASHADLARVWRYVRPTMRDDANLTIEGGRHPVVEQAREKERSDFTPNDCRLSDEAGRLWLLTGPNMAGKSTFLRQNALVVLLAQMGCYVPANSAEIGIADRLFSRVGAADDLARGRSTFMVEMVETAMILNAATSKSLVILDEIGRGTATFDGLSIAWAVLERLHDANRCRALFATHYHELTSLRSRLKSLTCHQMRVRQWRDQIVFLHQVIAGSADRSYGIHVAKLAGLPQPVIKRAASILRKLEDGQISGTQGIGTHRPGTLPLFQMQDQTEEIIEDSIVEPKPSKLEVRLAGIEPDALSPKQSMELIYELKALADEKS